jgi:nicotinate phosphoribosyltransferase
MDFAQRANDHNFNMDPIVRSLTDTDFYKPLMHQFIWKRHFNTRVCFGVTNRTKDVLLAKMVPIEAIKEQFDAARELRYTKTELVQLRGQSYYGLEGIFTPAFIDFLRTFQLPEYQIELEKVKNGPAAWTDTGQYDIRFDDRWAASSPWELHSLTIINELRNRALMKSMSRSELDIMYARAKVKLYAKLQALATDPTLDGISVSDFGTRRRHSFLWQEYVVQTMAEVLGDRFGGTSNVHLAMKHGFEARGTNAHELPMVYAALAKDDAELAEAPYKLCHDWQADMPAALRIMLPDTFGTTGFLADAPLWLADWAGVRPDSKKAIPAGEEIIKFYADHGKDPTQKLIIPSDGLDVRVPGYEPQGEDIPTIYRHFKGRIRQSFGWGTLATNDFVGCHPSNDTHMKPISLVCKVKSAEGHPAVKLSDNYNKATGPASEIERYRGVFGVEGINGAPVLV